MIEVLVALIGGVFTLSVTLIEKRRRRDHRENKATLDEVRYQTANDHSSNLRDDLDDIKADVKDLVFIVKEVLVPEIGALRAQAGRTDNRLDLHIAASA